MSKGRSYNGKRLPPDKRKYVIPVPELGEALNLSKDQIATLLCSVYGLTQAPIGLVHQGG